MRTYSRIPILLERPLRVQGFPGGFEHSQDQNQPGAFRVMDTDIIAVKGPSAYECGVLPVFHRVHDPKT